MKRRTNGYDPLDNVEILDHTPRICPLFLIILCNLSPRYVCQIIFPFFGKAVHFLEEYIKYVKPGIELVLTRLWNELRAYVLHIEK
jgi:hypothetical protein